MSLPYTHTSETKNAAIASIMERFDDFMAYAKSLGFNVCLYPEAKPLVLYFHDDYPDVILVDKHLSSER